LLVARQLHDLLFIAGIIGCDARRCLSDFAKRCAFVGVVWTMLAQKKIAQTACLRD
jgi:hypothetical protein